MDILNIENCTIRYQEQEAAVFHGERVVRVIQKNGSLFVFL
jgi:hypothetical protein